MYVCVCFWGCVCDYPATVGATHHHNHNRVSGPGKTQLLRNNPGGGVGGGLAHQQKHNIKA